MEDTRHWAALALSPEEKMSVEDPLEMERLADALPVERAAKRWIVSTDPEEHVERIKPYVDLGFRHLVFHAPGPDQERFLRLYATRRLPLLRKRFRLSACQANSPAGARWRCAGIPVVKPGDDLGASSSPAVARKRRVAPAIRRRARGRAEDRLEGGGRFVDLAAVTPSRARDGARARDRTRTRAWSR